jgi:acyl-CoA synthetase (AMP-forming)/AMP-acid ligase II
LGPNCPFVADALQAVPALQAVLVPINTRLTEGEVTYLLENSGASFVLVDSQFAHLVASAKVPIVRCADSGDKDDPYERFLEEGAEFDKRSGGLGWEGLVFQRDELATFAISYTSGTTSKPKGEPLPSMLGFYWLRGRLCRCRDFVPRNLPRRPRELDGEQPRCFLSLPLDSPDVPLPWMVLSLREHSEYVYASLPACRWRLLGGLERVP